MNEKRSSTPLERGLVIAGVAIMGALAATITFRGYGDGFDDLNRDPQPTVTEAVDMPDPVTTTVVQP